MAIHINKVKDSYVRGSIMPNIGVKMNFRRETSLHLENLGLVDFVDNWPWTSIGHGQLSMSYGQCPCNMTNVHVTWAMSMKSKKMYCPWPIVHEIDKTRKSFTKLFLKYVFLILNKNSVREIKSLYSSQNC